MKRNKDNTVVAPLSPSLKELGLFLDPCLKHAISLACDFPNSGSDMHIHSSPVQQCQFESALSNSAVASAANDPSGDSQLQQSSFFFPSNLRILIPAPISAESISSYLKLTGMSGGTD